MLKIKVFEINPKITLNKKLVIVAPSANWIGKTCQSKFLFFNKKMCNNINFKNSHFIIVGPKNEKSIESLFKLETLPIFDLVGKLISQRSF